MRTLDERVVAVRSRSKRLRQRRRDHAFAALACLAIIPLLCLAGRGVVIGSPTATGSGGELFGAASLFGSSAGGYVLVAVLAATVAVAVTVLIMARKRRHGEESDETEKLRQRDTVENAKEKEARHEET